MAVDSSESKLNGRLVLDSQQESHTKLETVDKSKAPKEELCFAEAKSEKLVANKKIPLVICCPYCGKAGDQICCSASVRRSELLKCIKKLKSEGKPRKYNPNHIPRGKRMVYCSLCAQPGHNRRTCPTE